MVMTCTQKGACERSGQFQKISAYFPEELAYGTPFIQKKRCDRSFVTPPHRRFSYSFEILRYFGLLFALNVLLPLRLDLHLFYLQKHSATQSLPHPNQLQYH